MNDYSQTALKVQFALLAVILCFTVGPKIFADEKTTLDGSSAAVALSSIPVTSPSPATTTTASRTRVPGIIAKSYFVWDMNDDRVLFAQDENVIHPLASLTKVMTGLVATEILPANTEISISASDLSEEGDSGLHDGERWLIGKLLDLTLVSSSNDGASAIAVAGGKALLNGAEINDATLLKERFVKKMNSRAHDLGLTHTYFRNESGLDVDPSTPGGEGSARDIAVLFEYVTREHPSLLADTGRNSLVVSSEDKTKHKVANTNEIVETLPGIIGSKTGFTDLAGGNLVVVVDIGIDHPVVIAVLGSTREGRFSDVQKLTEASARAVIENDH